MKISTTPLVVILTLVSLCFLAEAQAVSPPPDGGYPNGNTAEGDNTLLSLSSGFYNTAIGLDSLLSITAGNFCTGVGAGTLLLNIGNENTATGAGALLSNTTAGGNTAMERSLSLTTPLESRTRRSATARSLTTSGAKAT
jgi:hypothetical protein